MMMGEYKERVLHELEKAVNTDEVEGIVSRSIERFPEIDLFRYLVIVYLHILQKELQKLSEQNGDSPRKRNIHRAVDNLRQMRINPEKAE